MTVWITTEMVSSTTLIAPGGTTKFKLRARRNSLPPFLPIGWTKYVSFYVKIANSDPYENPYQFRITFILEKDS